MVNDLNCYQFVDSKIDITLINLQDDKEAHDRFLKITRAYEVLKDEDMRKKFDMHGEEGLSENFGRPKYESWQFYQENFGL